MAHCEFSFFQAPGKWLPLSHNSNIEVGDAIGAGHTHQAAGGGDSNAGQYRPAACLIIAPKRNKIAVDAVRLTTHHQQVFQGCNQRYRGALLKEWGFLALLPEDTDTAFRRHHALYKLGNVSLHVLRHHNFMECLFWDWRLGQI